MVIDGLYYALGCAAGGLVVAWLAGPVYGVPLFVAALFCLYFFRDPERQIPSGAVAVSPADGKVVALEAESPSVARVSIFMNLFDVHVNRSPIAGRIAQVRYQRGALPGGQPPAGLPAERAEYGHRRR